MNIRVIGIGNPLRGDDGIGLAVVEALQRGRLPAGVEIIEGGEVGVGLIGLMEGADSVVLVDAAEMGLEPGAFRVFGLNEITVAGETLGCSAHEVRVGVALRMAEALECLPQDVKVVGVQPKQMDWGIGLSYEVSEALEKVAEAVWEILDTSNRLKIED